MKPFSCIFGFHEFSKPEIISEDIGSLPSLIPFDNTHEHITKLTMYKKNCIHCKKEKRYMTLIATFQKKSKQTLNQKS